MSAAATAQLFDPIGYNPASDVHLASALGRGDRADFNLWLATFSADVTEQPYLQNPLPAEPVNWERMLGAARSRPLAAANDQVPRFGLTSNSDLADHRLQDALHPQALVLDASADYIPLHVWQNLGWQAQRREKQRREGVTSPARQYQEHDLGELAEQARKAFSGDLMQSQPEPV
ncbi:MAG: VC2046/SO_2500 family protein [Idiomarina sp.]